MPLESLYSQTKNLCVSLGISSIDPFVDLYLVSKTDRVLRSALNSWVGLCRSEYVRGVHLLEEAPTSDTVKIWRQLLKIVVWKQCKHLLISTTIRNKVLNNINLIAQKCKELGDLFPTHIVTRDMDESLPTPLLDLVVYVGTLDWQDCLEVKECINTYLLNLHNTHRLIDLRRGVIPLVLSMLEDNADKCVGHIDFLCTLYILSRFYRYKKDICKNLVQPTPLDNLLWEATWNPSFVATSGDLISVIREVVYEIVMNGYIKEGCTWLFVGSGPAFVSYYLENFPEESHHYISLMNFAYSGCLLVTKHYLEFLHSHLSSILTTTFTSYPELEAYLQSLDLVYTPPSTLFDEIVGVWTTPITLYKFTGGDESWSTLMLLIYNDVLKPLEHPSRLVDVDCLFTLLSTLVSFVGDEDSWKSILRFLVECCYWDGTEEKYEALTTSLWMYLSGKLESRVHTNEYNSQWLLVWREFVSRSISKFPTKVPGEVYNRLRELYNTVDGLCKRAKQVLPSFYEQVTRDMILLSTDRLRDILESRMWDIDVPTLMDNIRSYLMYNSITLTPQQLQKLLDVVVVVVNKKLFNDREAIEALVGDPTLTDILINITPTLESYADYISELKQQVVKNAVANMSETLEYQINSTQSTLYQSLNDVVASFYTTLKNARDTLYIDPFDVTSLRKFEQTKTQILKNCVSHICTSFLPTLREHFTPSTLQQYSGGHISSPVVFDVSESTVDGIIRSIHTPSTIKTYSTFVDTSFSRDVASTFAKSYSQVNSTLSSFFRLPNLGLGVVGSVINSVSSLISTAVGFSTLPLTVVRNINSLISNVVSTVSNVFRTLASIVELPTTIVNNIVSTVNSLQSTVATISNLGVNLLDSFDRLEEPVGRIRRLVGDELPFEHDIPNLPNNSSSSILQSFSDCPSCLTGGDPSTDEKLSAILRDWAQKRKTGSYTDNEHAYNAELLG